MPKPNPYLTENKKPFQTAQELKDEYKVPTYEEFMKGYENDEGINESYEDEIRSYGNIEVGKKCGPMYRTPSTSDIFSIEYRFSHENAINKCFFKIRGAYSNEWKMEGNLWDIKEKLRELEDGKISVVKLNQWGNYEKFASKEEWVKKCLREDVRKLEKAIRNGEIISKRRGASFLSDPLPDGMCDEVRTWEDYYHIGCGPQL